MAMLQDELISNDLENRSGLYLPDGRLRPELLLAQPTYYVGLDLGQSRNYTAMAVVERAEVLDRSRRDPVTMSWLKATYIQLRMVERTPLGLPYPEIVARVKGVLGSGVLEQARIQLVVDATGVGAPVVDLLKNDPWLIQRARSCQVIPVTITGGESGASSSGDRWRVPKRDLVDGLVVAVQDARLAISRECGALQELVDELRHMRHLGGGRRGGVGAHDDLVMALAMAWWRARSEVGRLD